MADLFFLGILFGAVSDPRAADGAFYGQSPSTAARLRDTVESIRSRIDDERTDSTGIRIRTRFVAEGCRVSLRKDGGALTVLTGEFELKDIAYLDVVDRPVGTLWTGAFLVFKTGEDRAVITRADLSGADSQLVRRSSSSFDWHLGSVRSGESTSSLHELGSKLTDAFAEAIGLCGGVVRK